MPTTEDILKRARELGELIAQHPAALKLDEVMTNLQKDVEAQRAMNDFNRQLQTLAEKEAGGKPIEVEDKRKLESLQKAVVNHPLLRGFQMAQMDYLDLMRRVDEAIEGQGATRGVSAGGTPAPTGVGQDFTT